MFYSITFCDSGVSPRIIEAESPQRAILWWTNFIGEYKEVLEKAFMRTESVEECVELYNVLMTDREYKIHSLYSGEKIYPITTERI